MNFSLFPNWIQYWGELSRINKFISIAKVEHQRKEKREKKNWWKQVETPIYCIYTCLQQLCSVEMNEITQRFKILDAIVYWAINNFEKALIKERKMKKMWEFMFSLWSVVVKFLGMKCMYEWIIVWFMVLTVQILPPTPVTTYCKSYFLFLTNRTTLTN